LKALSRLTQDVYLDMNLIHVLNRAKCFFELFIVFNQLLMRLTQESKVDCQSPEGRLSLIQLLLLVFKLLTPTFEHFFDPFQTL
jgi:hypothetical protein